MNSTELAVGMLCRRSEIDKISEAVNVSGIRLYTVNDVRNSNVTHALCVLRNTYIIESSIPTTFALEIFSESRY
jgi:hypothetical protein